MMNGTDRSADLRSKEKKLKTTKPTFEELKNFIAKILPEGKKLSDKTIKEIAEIYSTTTQTK